MRQDGGCKNYTLAPGYHRLRHVALRTTRKSGMRNSADQEPRMQPWASWSVYVALYKMIGREVSGGPESLSCRDHVYLLAKTRLSYSFAAGMLPFPAVSQKKHIAIIPGDGIGREVIPEAVKVIAATKAPVELKQFDWSADRYLADGVTIPSDGFAMLGRDFDAILVGAFGDPRVPTNIHAKEILLGMRFKMDLYANVRPVRLLDAALCPLKGIEPNDIDFVVVRENTEGVYGDLGGVFKQGTPDEIATQEDINTRKGVERITRYAFDYCERHTKQDGSPRKRVLMSDQSNGMTHAGSLWQRTFKEVAREYPQITSEHMYVDALCLQMVRDPRQFDVIVTNNMFGDIITDLAAGLQGGLGMAASGNIHPGKTSMFEPVHGSAPGIAGKNVANPRSEEHTSELQSHSDL